jgi:hypothetical protein
MLIALDEMFATVPTDVDTPFLPHFVAVYMRQSPAEAAEIVDLFNELSHGVFVDPHARRLWTDSYLAALRLDLPNLKFDRVEAALKRWRQDPLKDATILFSRLGPQIPCEVPSRTILLVALGESAPLRFDVNTAEPGVLRMIPGITEDAVSHWQSERQDRFFSGPEEFRSRAGLSEDVLAELRFEDARAAPGPEKR